MRAISCALSRSKALLAFILAYTQPLNDCGAEEDENQQNKSKNDFARQRDPFYVFICFRMSI